MSRAFLMRSSKVISLKLTEKCLTLSSHLFQITLGLYESVLKEIYQPGRMDLPPKNTSSLGEESAVEKFLSIIAIIDIIKITKRPHS